MDGFAPSYYLTWALNHEGRWRVKGSSLSFLGAPYGHLLTIVTQSDLGWFLTIAHRILLRLDLGTIINNPNYKAIYNLR